MSTWAFVWLESGLLDEAFDGIAPRPASQWAANLQISFGAGSLARLLSLAWWGYGGGGAGGDCGAGGAGGP